MGAPRLIARSRSTRSTCCSACRWASSSSRSSSPAGATAIGSLITFIGIPVALLTVAATRGLANVERRRAELVLGAAGARRLRGRGCRCSRDDWRELRRDLGARSRRSSSTARRGRTSPTALLSLVDGHDRLHGRRHRLGDDARADHRADVVVGGRRRRPATPDIGARHVERLAAGRRRSLALGLLLAAAGRRCSCTAPRTSCAATAPACSAPATRQLEQRVEHLEETRAGAVDAARLELERIERDLHDGAQARIVAVAMELGRAEQKLAAGEDADAAQLVREAREETQRALAELRDLARGIRPALLSERGLRRGDHVADRARGRPGDRRVPRLRAGSRRRSRRPPTSSSPRRSRTSPSTPQAPSAAVRIERRGGAARGRGPRRRRRRRRPRRRRA